MWEFRYSGATWMLFGAVDGTRWIRLLLSHIVVLLRLVWHLAKADDSVGESLPQHFARWLECDVNTSPRRMIRVNGIRFQTVNQSSTFPSTIPTHFSWKETFFNHTIDFRDNYFRMQIYSGFFLSIIFSSAFFLLRSVYALAFWAKD